MTADLLPRSILYATSAHIGGYGLDAVAYETLVGIQDRLGLALSYGNRAADLRHLPTRSLAWHPVRLLSSLDSKYYYGAKKKALDHLASQLLRSRRFDLFHGWSGEALHSLRVARRLGIPSVLEIPTWHRHKGNQVPPKTERELEMERAPVPQRWLYRLLISRQQTLEEYELADLILVLSQRAEETFRVVGTPAAKLFRMSRGVDVNRFRPGSSPPGFRAVFVGALIRRKGVHVLLEAWDRLRLPGAELWLVGHVHAEIKPRLENLPPGVRVLGFTREIEKIYPQCSVHVFPSECEGSAKSTYEAAACGLPQIATREAGDVVIDGLNGIIVPPNDPESLAAAIERLYRDRPAREAMGRAGRERVVSQFTWDHFRQRLLEAYGTVLERSRVLPMQG
ncbi:MAG: glycosyltransferase family 4 protein [Verrucomicrobia bacterium]|nr:glycosyltransferase family 4 protein [Verrucomicrobiota bacterium]